MNEEDPAFFAGLKVGIVGMGLMGSSLALALRGKCARLIGIDPDPQVAAYIREHEFVDQAGTDLTEMPPDTNLIILAAPVRAIIHLLEQLPQTFSGQAVVIDCGSTKTAILQAMQALPERLEPIGGHPMCGKEKLGPQEADAGMFKGNPFVLVPLDRTTTRARRTGEILAEMIGARLLRLDPQTHDSWVAQTSHLPFLTANALAGVTPGECAPLARSGWQSSTRLANTPTSMMMDIITTNRDNILTALQSYRVQIEKLEELIRLDRDDDLKAELDRGTQQYRSIQQQGK